MIEKIKNKMNNMSQSDWITFSLWLLTFVLLLVFVICAASIDKTNTEKITVAAQKGVAYPGAQFVKDHPNIVTSFADDNGVTSMTKFNIAEHTKELDNKAYALTLASTGFLMALSLIAALFTTVIFAYKKKKGGKV